MHYLLFTTSGCFKCPNFKKKVLKEITFNGEALDENSDDFLHKAEKFSITSVPSVIVFKDKTLKKEVFRTSEEYDFLIWAKDNL